MFTILFCIIVSISIGLGIGLLYFKFNSNISNLLSRKPEDNVIDNFSESYFIKPNQNIIFNKGSIYASLKFKIDTSNIDKKHYYKLLYVLKSLYVLESKFKDLLDLKLISSGIYDHYIKSIKDTRQIDYDNLYDTAIKNYPYSFETSLSKLEIYLSRLDEVLNDYDAKTVIKNISKQNQIKTISSDIINDKKDNVKDEFLISIKNKNSILNNVISNSLYDNATNLVKIKSNSNLSKESIDLIDLQLSQIDSFLQKEIDSSNNLSESELVNKLKANQIYLDSLNTHWISESK